MHRSSTFYRQQQPKTVLQYISVYFGVQRGQKVTDFVTVESFIMDYGLLFWPETTV